MLVLNSPLKTSTLHIRQAAKTVLVVDDDLDFLTAMEKRLSHAGYTVMVASNGEDALEIAKSGDIDAITLDVRMPGGASGIGVAALLRDTPETADVPILFVTGIADAEFKARCQEVGVKYFVCKPYDPDLLIHLLNKVLEEGAPEEGGSMA